MDKISRLILDMINFDAGNPELIQHFVKVYEFSRLIGSMECRTCEWKEKKAV